MINETWAFFCIVGFWGWVSCTIGFIIKSFPEKGVFRGESARVWGCALLLFYSLWIFGMLNT